MVCLNVVTPTFFGAFSAKLPESNQLMRRKTELYAKYLHAAH